jgi:hypothetical protein
MDKPVASPSLEAFRSGLYACLGRRRDALFELADALVSGSSFASPVHLSLEPSHRRGWGSLYAALARGQVDVGALQALVASTAPPESPRVYAVDVSVWPRCDAETSPERGYYYHPSRHSAGQPIVAGWAYQWLAQLSFSHDSWTVPLQVRRLHPSVNIHVAAAEQIRALLTTQPHEAAVPLFVFDAGYDPEQLAQELGEAPVAVLVRLRRDRCFYADPTSQAATGRPRVHGAKFVCQEPATWPSPTTEHRTEDGRYGRVHVRAWAGLHAKRRNHPARGSRRPRPFTRGTLVLVEVERLPSRSHAPRQLWLWWSGPGSPDLDLLWRAYVHRFDLEHTFRFLKQSLGWTTPRVRQPEQADRWSWLVLAAYTQLRLARARVADRRLPWERPLEAAVLTPARVRRAFSALLLLVGTPAAPPQPAGRSPGRPKGRRSGPARRYPAIKKAA